MKGFARQDQRDPSAWFKAAKSESAATEIEMGKESSKTYQEFLQAWEEAHRLFQEKQKVTRLNV